MDDVTFHHQQNSNGRSLRLQSATASSHEQQHDRIMYDEIIDRLARLELSLQQVSEAVMTFVEASRQSQERKEYLTTGEFAELVGRARFTVREWARNLRVHSQRTSSGRGPYAEYRFSLAEVQRYRREGLLPLRRSFARGQEE